MWSGSLPTDLRPVPAPLNAIILRCFACRWGSAERAVVAFVPGGGGRLLLRPLHLRLPHAGLPMLQEGRHRLQGELAAAACWTSRGETNCVHEEGSRGLVVEMTHKNSSYLFFIDILYRETHLINSYSTYFLVCHKLKSESAVEIH